nr:lithostathine-1-beta [Macaca fascicularis]
MAMSGLASMTPTGSVCCIFYLLIIRFQREDGDPTSGSSSTSFYHIMNCHWHWSSGSLVSYKSWDTGAPSCANTAYCASLTPSSGFKKWKEDSCKEKFSFVCKFKYWRQL